MKIRETLISMMVSLLCIVPAFSDTIHADVNTQQQQIDGFGASAGAEALTPEQADLLFSATNGIGLSFVRMGTDGGTEFYDITNPQGWLQLGVCRFGPHRGALLLNGRPTMTLIMVVNFATVPMVVPTIIKTMPIIF